MIADLRASARPDQAEEGAGRQTMPGNSQDCMSMALWCLAKGWGMITCEQRTSH